jgi:hypothetical protein
MTNTRKASRNFITNSPKKKSMEVMDNCSDVGHEDREALESIDWARVQPRICCQVIDILREVDLEGGDVGILREVDLE